jgi:hypothetical protein
VGKNAYYLEKRNIGERVNLGVKGSVLIGSQINDDIFVGDYIVQKTERSRIINYAIVTDINEDEYICLSPNCNSSIRISKSTMLEKFGHNKFFKINDNIKRQLMIEYADFEKFVNDQEKQ